VNEQDFGKFGKPEVVRYGGAVVALTVATGLRVMLDPLLDDYAPFLVFLIAVVFTARYAGTGPALLVLLGGSLLANFFFTTPRGSLHLLDPRVEVSLFLELLAGLLIIHVTRQLRVSRARARSSEERLQMATQAGAIGTFDIDYTKGTANWSPQAMAIFGLEPDDPVALDTKVPKAVHAADYEQLRLAVAAWQNPLGSGQWDEEHRIVRPDGSERWVHVRGKAFFSGEGAERRAMRCTGAVHDITESKLAKAALEQRTHSLQERVKELECLYSVARITQQQELSSRALAQIMASLKAGYQYPEITCVRITLYGTVHATCDFSEVVDAQRSAIELDDQVVGWVEVGYMKDPPRATQGLFLREERNLIDAIARLLADNILRQRDRAALAESESRFRGLVEAMPEILYRGTLPHYTLTFISPPIERLLGFTPAEWMQVRDRWLRQLHDDDRERVLKEAAAVRHRPELEFSIKEYRLWHKDGRSFRWFRDSTHMDRDQAGRVVAFVGVLSDVTELKRLEHALQDADRRKDAFLATLAHELRNPLAPIRNALAIIRLGADRPEIVSKALDMGERQMGQLVRLVDELLDIARISSGKIRMHPQRVSLKAIVERAVESSRPQIDAGHHELVLEEPPAEVQLQADPVRLAQALSNLLNNAAKYTESGGRIRLATRQEGDELAIEIQDNGIGIAPEVLPQMFELFTQAAQSRHHIWQGLGVGLSLAKSLVELHGGELTGASPGPGCGSTFTIRLPVRSGPGDALRLQDDHPPAPVQPLRILVVDDDRDVAESTAMLLRQQGHEVHVVYDGAEAIRLACEQPPAVVFLDIGMPGLDGYEVARRMRACPELASTWLIALTGWGLEQDRRRSEAAGFDRHLVKPVASAALNQLLRTCAAAPRSSVATSG
jgi:PAS domain S-box-containing protein